MKDSIGYDGLHPIRNRVWRVAGRSSARVVPRPAGDSCRSSSAKKTNSPLKVSAMSAVPVAGSFRAVSLNSSVPAQLGLKSKPEPVQVQASSIKRQATSPEAQASSFKPQATSSVILEPRYKNTEEVFLGKGPRAFTMINVLLG